MQLNPGTPIPEKLTELDTLLRDMDAAIADLSSDPNNTPRMMLANRLRRSRVGVETMKQLERNS